MRLLSILALALATLLSACASTYKQDVVAAASAKLERSRSVLIATPRNGTYARKVYLASGQQTALAIHAAFARFSDQVAVSASCADLACLQADARPGVAYHVVPEILHWEDRNTEWSGIPDRVEVKIIVSDANTRSVIASVVIAGKSKWATFGGDHPEDLLPEPVKQYVESLY